MHFPPTDTGPHDDVQQAAAQSFVMELGRALVQFGTPAHRIEESLGQVSERLGLKGEFFSVPTALIASFAAQHFPRTHLARAEPGEVNLEKLVQLNELTDRVVDGMVAPPEGAAWVRKIVSAPSRYGPFATTLFCGLASAALSTVFGGGWAQACLSGGIGLLIGGLEAVSKRVPGFGRVFDLIAAFLASFLAHAAIGLAGPRGVYLITVSGLINLMPGLVLTVALNELSTRNLVSGTARLMGAAVTLLKLAFGVALGGRLGSSLFGAGGPSEVATAPLWIEASALLLAALAFTVLFQARPKDGGWILLAIVLALVGLELGNELLGRELGSSLGAFLATLGGNLYARYLRRPARVLLLPSIVILVPGTIGFRSVSLLLEKDVLFGVTTAFNMTLAAISLVAGILFANLLVPPRRVL